ncbi:MAG: leucine--tRNA ligase [Candidatus Bathyarchaeia archaeon]
MIKWKELEEKWQSRWEEEGAFKSDPDPDKPKFYLTVAYPYPNSPQHIGHGRTYTLTDVHARYQRMRGYNVLLPMAWHYTGTPLFAMVERLQERDPSLLDTFQNLYGIPKEKLKELEDPVSMANYFADEIKHGMERIGYSIDWRREFTTIDPIYSKFIEWQFEKLREKGYITQGSHPVGWCQHCGNPVGQHDTVGDKEPDIEEYTLIKFRKGNQVFPAATLRPETVFGVTNMWINPDALYVEADVDGENWIISSYASDKLQLLGREIDIIAEFQGSRLVGQKVQNPMTDDDIIILPANFVDPKNATGVVMSVPSHAPFDYVALEELKRNVRARTEGYNLRPKDVKSVEPISIIQVPGYEESPAVDVSKRMDIRNQDDTRLEEATKEVYSAEFHNGRMRSNTGQYASLNVPMAKEAIRDDMISVGRATTMYELTEPVQCRCGTEVVVKIFENQWFINYGDPAWKELAHENIDEMEIVPYELRQEFKNVVDWLKAKACARKAGLGTKLPWAKDWIIEALSDSVIYMAYYTVINGIKEIDPEPDLLTEEFWDYLFLGKGDPDEIAEKTGFPEEKLREMRGEFNYYYPLDARHSGRDLISNHLTYMIFNHDAIWPREKWPKGIVVNGSVLMEGEKMSKSLNNIIPLIDAIESFGSDPLRLGLMITAEPLKDADFSPDLAKNMGDNLERLYKRSIEIASRDPPDMKPELTELDKWMLSRLQGHIADANEAMKELKVRKTIHAALYDLDQDWNWYKQRIAGNKKDEEREQAINYVENIIIDSQVHMLAPFTPHICEEIWEEMGGEGFIAFSTWPEVDEELVQRDAEELEGIIQTMVEDIKKIISVTGIEPQEVHIYTADPWKWKIYMKALELKEEGKLSVGTLIREAFKDDENKARAEEVPPFTRSIVEDIQRVPEEKIQLRRKMGIINEAKLLQDSEDYFRGELGAEIHIGAESDPWIEDPENRADRAKPYRPAIYVE